MNQNSFLEPLEISFGNMSDVGKVRKKNEDYMGSFKSSFGEVYVVCDGMGGHVGGEVASRLAVDTIKEYILSNPKSITDTNQIISESLLTANKALHAKTQENPDLIGMGTTCVILILKSGIAYYGCVGDSRIYLIRGNKIFQLTRDQSFVQTLIDQGLISYEDAENHPRKNEIMQALGIHIKIVPVVKEEGLKIYKDDKFILCSDGLSGMVEDNDILEIVNQLPPMKSCEKLVSLANIHGGNDNITVQIIHLLNGEILPGNLIGIAPEGSVDKNYKTIPFEKKELSETQEDFSYQKKKSKSYLYYLLGVVLLLIAALAVWYFILRKGNISQDEIKTTNNVERVEDEKVFSDFKTFLEKNLFRGDDINVNLNLPENIIIKNVNYQPVKGGGSKDLSFSDFISIIKTKDYRFESLNKPEYDKNGKYYYKLELTVKDKDKRKTETFNLGVLGTDKKEIVELKYYEPPPQKEENKPIQPEHKKKDEPKQDKKEDDNKDKTDDKQKNTYEDIFDKGKDKIEKGKEKIEKEKYEKK